MTFIKQNAGLLRSARSWGVLGLLLALAVIASVYQQTQAVPQANTVKLWEQPYVISKTSCPLVAWVAFVPTNGSPYPLKGYIVEFWRVGEAIGDDDPCGNNDPNDGCYGKSISGNNGQALFSVPRPPTGSILIQAIVRISINPPLVLVSNQISCGAYDDHP